MKAFVASLLLCGACIGDDIPHENYPVLPGGGGLVNPSAGGSNDLIVGRVCMSTDLLRLDLCITEGLAGLTVRLDGRTAVTADDGSFSIPTPVAPPTAFEVSGIGAVTTTTPFVPNAVTIPVIDADVWARSLASNQIGLPPGTGSILGSVIRNDVPASGITVASTPTSAFSPLFDAGTIFGPGQTGQRGVFLVPGITAGTSSLTFNPGETLVAGIPVINGGVTILDSLPLP